MKQNQRILLIDDEDVIVFGFTKVLTEPGVELDCAQTLEEAQNFIADNQYKAAIVDLRLSNSTKLEGFECIKILRCSQSECRILVLTAFGDNTSRKQAEALGVDFFLEKPMEPDAVKEILKKFGIYNN